MTGNNGVSGNPPSGKKRKHEAGLDDMILVPVARANFENVNQVWPLAQFFLIPFLWKNPGGHINDPLFVENTIPGIF